MLRSDSEVFYFIPEKKQANQAINNQMLPLF